ncbi:MAG: hypothetical protein ACREHG_05560, partial [Candidatus Saccharimonadales bacterium]
LSLLSLSSPPAGVPGAGKNKVLGAKPSAVAHRSDSVRSYFSLSSFLPSSVSISYHRAAVERWYWLLDAAVSRGGSAVGNRIIACSFRSLVLCSSVVLVLSYPAILLIRFVPLPH